mmetsp:Transcript_13079/g.16181  ORF Transcript_13079/g.16181 Transcript_13079/m.16181 type:complete len:208 (-) Transcript_13079:41-664(-)
MSSFFNKHVFSLPWESVTNAWIQKYPNKHSLQIDQVDTISREMSNDGSFRLRRLIRASMNPPSWMISLGMPSHVYVLEEAIINQKTKKMILKSINITGSNWLQVQETCQYYWNNIKNKTEYKQTANITSFVPIISSTIESFAKTHFKENAIKGLNAMDELCEKWKILGMKGYQEILKIRLDMVSQMKSLNEIQSLIKQYYYDLKKQI